MQINEKQLEIYNAYLRALADANNRPYKKLKNCDKLTNETLIVLQRLEQFFTSYKHIFPYNFFTASFKYKNINFIRLEDFLKYSATVAYSKWSTMKYQQSLESDSAIADFLKGFKFILDYCEENKLTLLEYRTKLNKIGVKIILTHLNQQKISYYHLHALKLNIDDLDSDYVRLTFNDFNGIFCKTKEQYENSNTIKRLANKLTHNKL